MLWLEPKHPPQDVALEVGLEPVAGRIENPHRLLPAGILDLRPLGLQRLRQQLQQALVVRTARHQEVRAVGIVRPSCDAAENALLVHRASRGMASMFTLSQARRMISVVRSTL
jgi:hypothetical protein